MADNAVTTNNATVNNDNNVTSSSAIFVMPEEEVREALQHEHPVTLKEFTIQKAGRADTKTLMSSEETGERLEAVMESMLETTVEEDERKRENANINAKLPAAKVHKIASEVSKEYYLDHYLPADQAKAHRAGDIHIHDLDFLSETFNCIPQSGKIFIKYKNEIIPTDFSWFDRFFSDQEFSVKDIENKDVYIFDFKQENNFTRIKRVSRRLPEDNEKVVKITTNYGQLITSKNHIIPILNNEKQYKEVKAEALQIGDILFGNSHFDTITEEHGEIQKSINKIDFVNINEQLYDLETDSHYFVCNNIRVHNCLQMDLGHILKNGWETEHGFLREPKRILSAAALAAITLQVASVNQFGGVSHNAFDYALAPYVALEFKRQYSNAMSDALLVMLSGFDNGEREKLKDFYSETEKRYILCPKMDMQDEFIERERDFLRNNYNLNSQQLNNLQSKIYDIAYHKTDSLTHEAMVSLTSNVSTMTARAAGQVVFASVNLGTDISAEGRMVTKQLLLAMDEGLGHGETCIFPIVVFKLKAGVSYEPEDPNYDLFKLACRVSAKRLYPNFVNLDASYNKKYLIPGKVETEIATMGCVDSQEIVTIKNNDGINVIPFKKLWDNYANNDDIKYSGRTEYITDPELSVYDSYSNCFVKVKTLLRNKEQKDWYRIVFTGGRTILVTPDHPFPVEGRGRITAENLSIGDNIKRTNKIAFFNNNETTNDKEKLQAWYEGFMLCDGCYDGTVFASIGPDESELIPFLETAAMNYGFDKIHVKFQNRQNENGVNKGQYYDIGFRSSNLKSYMKKFEQNFSGIKKNERNIPKYVFEKGREYALSFLAGMIDADGSISSKQYIQLGSTNKSLALQQNTLAEMLGYNSKVYINHYSSDKNKIRYRVEMTYDNELVEAIKCNKKYQKLVQRNAPSCKKSDFVTVTKIEKIMRNNEYSYDVETESDRFDVSGICSHNCRTRTISNVYDPEHEQVAGRGNLFFVTINLPRLAILSNHDIDKFYELLDEKLQLCLEHLMTRFEIIADLTAEEIPFHMLQGGWLGADNLRRNEKIREVLKHGSMSIGFVGLAETLKSLIGKHHGESALAQELGLQIVGHIRDFTDAAADKYKLNFSTFATPAESTAGAFAKKDQERFGIIPGVTEHEYYTNSSHVPVYYDIDAFSKIKIEGPYHALENAGHIAYVEMDGDPLKNLSAFEAVVRCFHDNDCGYFSINHPVDQDKMCGYVGIIDDVCPKCGRHEGEAMSEEKAYEIGLLKKNVGDSGMANQVEALRYCCY